MWDLKAEGTVPVQVCIVKAMYCISFIGPAVLCCSQNSLMINHEVFLTNSLLSCAHDEPVAFALRAWLRRRTRQRQRFRFYDAAKYADVGLLIHVGSACVHIDTLEDRMKAPT